MESDCTSNLTSHLQLIPARPDSGSEALRLEGAQVMRRAAFAGVADRNSGGVHARSANAAVTESRTASSNAEGKRTSTEPPKPPPIIRAPAAPAASAASTAMSASGQDTS